MPAMLLDGRRICARRPGISERSRWSARKNPDRWEIVFVEIVLPSEVEGSRKVTLRACRGISRLRFAPFGMTLVRCCSRAVKHAAWARTKRHFFFAENRSGKFNSKHCVDCDWQKFSYRQERIHHGGLR